MDEKQFDQLARILGASGSRRSLFGALAGAALTSLGLRGEAEANSAENCRAVGDSCNGNGNCCSHNCGKESRARKICHCASADDCPASTNPCVSSVCLPTGSCGTTVNQGQACDDGNACTTNDACQADGSCQGTPMTCAAKDQCHVTGTCDPQTGQCSNPAATDRTPCNDGDACTQTDTCQSGVCVGSNPTVCVASDQCHVAGTCDPATGVCSNPNKTNGTPCNDGNACTIGDACQSGVCQGGAAVVCTASDQCHVAGTCDPKTGVCSNPNAPDGTSCDDGNACTTNDTCQGGSCAGGPPLVCNSGNRCLTDACDPKLGCTTTPKPAGTACDNATLCNGHEICDGAGTCLPGTPVVCMASDQCHAVGTCDPSTGQCSNPPLGDNTPCDDGNLCTVGDTCQRGACVPGPVKTCVASDQCHVAGTCDPKTGVCSNPAATDGTACNDGNACTQTDTCQGGTCVGSNSVVCAAMDQCHVAGTCDPTTGLCSNPDKSDGAGCDDKNACTQSDTCQSGVCTGTNPIVCTPADACHVTGTCDPATGVCSNPAGNDGAPCGTPTCANGELTTYACAGGACAPTTAPCPGDLICATGGTACLTSCGTDGDCLPGFYCASGTCLPKQVSGTSCGSGDQCLSGNCVGDFCCSSASCGSCESCASGMCASTCAPGQVCAHNEYCCTPNTSLTACQGVPGETPAKCGIIAGNCGQPIDCGACTAPNTCGGGGTPNICGCPGCPNTVSYTQTQHCTSDSTGCCYSGPGNYSCNFMSPNSSCCSGVCVEMTSQFGYPIGQCT